MQDCCAEKTTLLRGQKWSRLCFIKLILLEFPIQRNRNCQHQCRNYKHNDHTVILKNDA